MVRRCSCARTSYATWRLQTLKYLYRSTEINPEPQLSFLYPWSIESRFGQRRDFHHSVPRTRNLLKDIRRTAKHKAVQLELKEQVKPGVQTETPSDGTTSAHGTESGKDRSWNPYSDKALEAIQGLVGDLRARAVKVAAKEKIDEEESVPFVGKILKRQNNKLRSPLESRLPWDRPAKLQVHEVEVNTKLENNIWAQMLASPVRMDRGLRTRLPRALTMSWGVMHNPHKRKDYMIPVALSDLSALKKELEQDDQDDVQDLANEVHKGRHTENARDDWSPQIAIVPDKLLVAAMTDKFTTRKLDRHGNVTSRDVASEFIKSYLVPYRWKFNQDELKAFARTRQAFDKALDRQPDADEPDLDGMARFDKLQWQFDIEDRIVNLSRERVLLAVEAVGQKNTSGRAIHNRKVVAIPVPDNGHLFLDSTGRIVESESLQSSKNSNEASENEKTVDIQIPEWVHGAIALYIGKPESSRQHFEKWEQWSWAQDLIGRPSPLPQLPSYDFMPPMITINEQFRIPVFNLEALFGEDQAHRIQQVVHANPLLTQKFWRQYNADPNGSTMRAGFQVKQDDDSAGSNSGTTTLDTALDAGEQVLSSIVTPKVDGVLSKTNTAITSTPPSAVNNNSHDTGEEIRDPYLLLIKPKAKRASVLIREVWQVWRYIGGRPSLYPATHTE